MSIFSVQGKLVKKIVSANSAIGYHSLVWHGKGYNATMAPKGLYIVRLQLGDIIFTRWVKLVR